MKDKCRLVSEDGGGSTPGEGIARSKGEATPSLDAGWRNNSAERQHKSIGGVAKKSEGSGMSGF